MSLDRATVEAWVRGEPGTVQAEDIAEDWLRKEEALREASQLLAEAYPGEQPTNRWRERVEELGAWPPSGEEEA